MEYGYFESLIFIFGIWGCGRTKVWCSKFFHICDILGIDIVELVKIISKIYKYYEDT